jgi:hypothetical protein
MKSKIILFVLAAVFFVSGNIYSQYLKSDKINLKQELKSGSVTMNQVKPTESKITLGIGIGFAFYEGTGVAVSMFSEMKFDKFSFVPAANFWKVENTANFEMAGIGRYTFKASNMNPYVDAGIGLNFYDKKNVESFTKVGLDLGAGIDFPGLIENAIVFVDGKYKIIISNGIEGNIYSYTLTGGLKFLL